MGRGHNVIEWLTVKNDRFGAGEIVTDLAPTSTPTSIRVAHVVASGGQRGIDARFAGAAFNNRTVVAVFEDNVLEHNVRGIGQGMRMLITGATGATLRGRCAATSSTTTSSDFSPRTRQASTPF